MVAGDHSFASLIRHQAEQRLDALRLADQHALAARVSAAAATPMPRPSVDHLASRPPMPSQNPAPSGPPKAVPSAATAPADTNAQRNPAQPHPLPTRPAQATAASARAKSPGTASHPEPARSPADSPATSRANRERKPGTTPGAEARAEDTVTGATATPLLPADSGLAGPSSGVAAVMAQAPGTALLPDLPPDLQQASLQPDLQTDRPPADGLPQQRSALPAGPATIGPAEPAGAHEVGTDGAGPPASRPVIGAPQTAPGSVAADESRRLAPSPPPTQALAAVTTSDASDAELPTAPRARIGGTPGPKAEASDKGGEDFALRPGDPPRPLDQVPAPDLDRPEARHHRGQAGPEVLPPVQPDAVAAAVQAGAWRPGTAPAADLTPAAPVDGQSASRRTGPGIDRTGPALRQAASPPGLAAARTASPGPAGLEGQAGAAVPTAQAQPAGAAAPGFDSALQAVLAPGTAPPGVSTGPERSGEAPLALQIEAPVDSPLFAPALGSQLSLLARDGVRSALLQLHPADMGPISVEIALDGNAAHIDFQALRADTRSLIEASLPALAGALQDAGLTLAGGGVFEQAPGRQPQPQTEQGQGARQPGQADSGPGSQRDAPQPARRAAPRGLVDLVA